MIKYLLPSDNLPAWNFKALDLLSTASQSKDPRWGTLYPMQPCWYCSPRFFPLHRCPSLPRFNDHLRADGSKIPASLQTSNTQLLTRHPHCNTPRALTLSMHTNLILSPHTQTLCIGGWIQLWLSSNIQIQILTLLSLTPNWFSTLSS